MIISQLDVVDYLDGRNIISTDYLKIYYDGLLKHNHYYLLKHCWKYIGLEICHEFILYCITTKFTYGGCLLYLQYNPVKKIKRVLLNRMLAELD